MLAAFARQRAALGRFEVAGARYRGGRLVDPERYPDQVEHEPEPIELATVLLAALTVLTRLAEPAPDDLTDLQAVAAGITRSALDRGDQRQRA